MTNAEAWATLMLGWWLGLVIGLIVGWQSAWRAGRKLERLGVALADWDATHWSDLAEEAAKKRFQRPEPEVGR